MFDTYRMKRELVRRTESGELEWRESGRVHKVFETRIGDQWVYVHQSGTYCFFRVASHPYPYGVSEVLFQSSRLHRIVKDSGTPPSMVESLRQELL